MGGVGGWGGGGGERRGGRGCRLRGEFMTVASSYSTVNGTLITTGTMK